MLTDEDFSPPPRTSRRGWWWTCEFITLRGQWRFTGLTPEWARYRAYQGMQPWGQQAIRERQAARQYGG